MAWLSSLTVQIHAEVGLHILNDYLPVKNMWLPKWRGAESMCCADTTNVIFHDGFLLFWKAINF